MTTKEASKKGAKKEIVNTCECGELKKKRSG